MTSVFEDLSPSRMTDTEGQEFDQEEVDMRKDE